MTKQIIILLNAQQFNCCLALNNVQVGKVRSPAGAICDLIRKFCCCEDFRWLGVFVLWLPWFPESLPRLLPVVSNLLVHSAPFSKISRYDLSETFTV